ncbi:MAG TPA: phosphatase [Opitutaceae bacterium]|nr:phosphatase [Opitutaceae bacterium]
MPPAVAVIDIGSNSIKVLVANRATDRSLTPLHASTLDARISAGISQAVPELSDEGMVRGVEAIRTLVADAERFSPERIILVATSAVRDASNGKVFRDRVRQETGREIRILSGSEEATLIGRGLTCDPALRHLTAFYQFDLGGGSLECLAFRDRQVEHAVSLQLGCVRLTEKFVPDPTRTFGRTPRYRTMQHVHDVIVRGGFPFTLPPGTPAVGTGGTVTTVRAIAAARQGVPLEQTDPFVPLTELRLLLTRLARLTLGERQQVPGLPAARADVFPVALATLIVVADLAGVPGYHHSLYNLRYGLADEALA